MSQRMTRSRVYTPVEDQDNTSYTNDRTQDAETVPETQTVNRDRENRQDQGSGDTLSQATSVEPSQARFGPEEPAMAQSGPNQTIPHQSEVERQRVVPMVQRSTETAEAPSDALQARVVDADGDEIDPEFVRLRRKIKAETQRRAIIKMRVEAAALEADDEETIEALKEGSKLARPASSRLPRPEPPRRYSKKNRVEYNHWVKDCEAYFIQCPADFQREVYKVTFSLQYVSDQCKTTWEELCLQKKSSIVGWQPTWTDLKQNMLNALGTTKERHLVAFDAVTTYKQGAKESPTAVLDYLRQYWEELGDAYPTALRQSCYFRSLTKDIQLRLQNVPVRERETLSQIEEQANIIYRHIRELNAPAAHQGKRPDRKASSGSDGDRKPQKRFKHGRHGQKGQERPFNRSPP
ncbi:hypothetical protein BKA66DRAFT_235076 [Pyrenochaeta sp. MPI-SDFR-AT-0127]|nr:hypothetical protein BKA66DRAFT_235076 [Pyrenochaeta sp. MPI-SDFR-AT-0127]